MKWSQIAACAASLAGLANAQTTEFPFPASCSGTGAFKFQYKVASGWKVTKLAGGLKQPRSVIFDTMGHMLVLQAGTGISAHTFGSNGCLNSTTSVISDRSMNHGLSLTPDGKTLYSSSEREAWAWDYDAATMKISNKRTVVRGISTGIHSTRTIHVVPNKPNLIVVSVGSNANFDAQAGRIRACVKVFDMAKLPTGGYQYNSEGWQLGWGLRNEVGITFDPNGMAWGVENSGDDFRRNGQDIHIDNPAEELNYLGDPSVPNDKWYGYPTCFTAWSGPAIQGKTGDQFVVNNNSYTDAQCKTASTPPRLTFQAHSAPIDATFDSKAENMYVTFHGSWNRNPATGYKLVEVPFKKLDTGAYDPVAAPDSMDGYKDIFGTNNEGGCSTQTLTRSSCLRLAAVTFDPSGKNLIVSSDNESEGELFILTKG